MEPLSTAFGGIWLVWMLVVLASLVVTIRAMLALARIPARLEAIELAIR